MKFLFGYKTNSLPLKDVTEHKGPWKWWGIAIGFTFFGFTKAENPNTIHPLRRVKSALHTNEPQITSVSLFTVMNMAAFLSRDTHPLWLGIVSLLFWPVLAFIFNLISPIPENSERENHDSHK